MSRFNFMQVAPEAVQLYMACEQYISKAGFDRKMVDLMKTRASQINGCAPCLDMHTQEARKNGESLQRLFCLNAWREAPFYSDQERAALELTEAVTVVTNKGVPEDVYELVKKHFTEHQIVDLVVIINTINSWNRLNITAHMAPPERKG